MRSPYKECPVFETEHFILRLVRPEDAEDLLACYADPKAQAFFNADRCTSDFCFTTAAEMEPCIAAWIRAYENEEFIRFAIVAKSLGKAVGTIEMFGMVGAYKSPMGVLRLDICSEYERPPFLGELLTLCLREFFPLFGVDQITHKAIPSAVHRIEALSKLGFAPLELPGRAHSWGISR